MKKLNLIFIILLLSAGIASAQRETLIPADSIPRGDFSVLSSLPLPENTMQLTENLSPEDRAQLREEGEIIYRHDGKFVPRLAINPALSEQLALRHRENKNDFALEVLMAIEIPQNLREEFSKAELDLLLFNIFHRVSSLSGLEYYSASRERMREFYLNSTVVQSEGDLTPLPDLVFASLIAESVFTIHQEDASFGENTYEVIATPDSMSMTNLTSMTYKIVRIAGPGDLDLRIQIERNESHILFYAVSSLKAPRILGIRNKVSNSFYNRIVALYRWFNHQLNTELP